MYNDEPSTWSLENAKMKMNKLKTFVRGPSKPQTDVDQRMEFIRMRIEYAEKAMGGICSSLGGYTRSSAKQRDFGDKLVEDLMEYADNEYLEQTTKEAIRKFAVGFSKVQDSSDTCVERTRLSVVNPLSLFNDKCVTAKYRLQKVNKSKNKEMKKLKNLEKKISEDSPNKAKVIYAESNANLAKMTTKINFHKLSEQFVQFEEEKITMLKKVLTNLIKVEMMKHAKSMEHLTKCFDDLSTIKIQEDTEVLRDAMHPKECEKFVDKAQQIIKKPNLRKYINKKLNPHKVKERRNTAETLDLSQLDIDGYREVRETMTELVMARKDSELQGMSREERIKYIMMQEYNCDSD